MNVTKINSSQILDDIKVIAGIEETAEYINTKLTEYILENNIDKKQLILDYPSQDIIRSIYQSNDPYNKELNKCNVEVCGREKFTTIIDSTISIGKSSLQNGITKYIIG